MSKTKAELLEDLRAARAALIVYEMEVEKDYDYLSPEEMTALEKYHREEASVWAEVANQYGREGDVEKAQHIREAIVKARTERANYYALRAAERTVQWDDEDAAEHDAAEDSP